MKHRKGLTWLTALPIAHRGLHDAELKRPENSLAAFAAALDAPYAIECDLHPSVDGVPMVFHDDTLDRLTEMTGNVRDISADELRQLAIAGTEERIPTLADLLALTNGAVPLILELKSQSARNDGFASAICELLKGYSGPVAVMSFDPQLMIDTRTCAPGLPRGIVGEGNWRSAFRVIRSIIRTNAHFVSYDIDDLPTPAPLFARYCLGLPLICYTVKSEKQRWRASRWTGQMTFEGFTP